VVLGLLGEGPDAEFSVLAERQRSTDIVEAIVVVLWIVLGVLDEQHLLGGGLRAINFPEIEFLLHRIVVFRWFPQTAVIHLFLFRCLMGTLL
jgi:hypothetical protein